MRRRALAVGGTALVLAALYWFVVRDPFGGRTQFVHRSEPAFNVLYRGTVVRREPGALLTLRARRGRLSGSVVVRRYALPDYEGDVAGILPTLAERLIEPGVRLTSDGRTRLNTAPGYEIAFTSPAGEGRDVILVPPEVEQPREGVLLSYRLTKPAGPRPPRVRRAAQALRSALRSFQFGTDRF